MTVKRLKNGTFEVRCRDLNGKQLRRRFADSRMADEFEILVVEQDVESEAAWARARGYAVPEKAQAPALTFSRFAEEVWYPALLSGDATESEEPGTYGHAQRLIKKARVAYPWIGARALASLTLKDFKDLKREIRTAPLNKGEPYAAGTANLVLKRAKQCMAYAVQAEHIPVNPFAAGRLIPDPRKPKVFWRPEEFKRFLSVLRDEREDFFIYFTVALQTALRKSELLGLRKGDIDFGDNVIKVYRQWDSDAYEYPLPGEPRTIAYKDRLKNGEPYKIVPMSEPLRVLLADYTSRIIGGETQLFQWTVKLMKHPGAIIKEFAPKAGVPVIKAHGTRDSAIGNLKKAGIADWVIAKMAGCNVKNLSVYGDLIAQDTRIAANAMGDMFE